VQTDHAGSVSTLKRLMRYSFASSETGSRAFAFEEALASDRESCAIANAKGEDRLP